MPQLEGIFEWCFVDPATIVDGKDARGYKVVELYGPGHATGPEPHGFFAQYFGRWPESLDKFAAEQAKYATWLETQGESRRKQSASARAATRTDARTHLAKIEIP